MDKKKLIKIGVPILIVLLVAGVWFAKNQEAVEPVTADIQVKATAIVPVPTSAPIIQGAVEPVTAKDPIEAVASVPVATSVPIIQGGRRTSDC
jgi:hypothetical protein